MHGYPVDGCFFSSLTPGRPSYSWELSQLDCLAEAARYSPAFRLVINCNTAEECSGRDVAWAEASASMLLFNSDQVVVTASMK